MAYLLVACQVLLLAVFGVSAAGKLRGRVAWSRFVASVRELRLLPAPLVAPVAAGTVAAEVAVVVLLAVPATVPAGVLLAGLLLVAFTTVVALTVYRRVPAVCRCFGRASAAPMGRRHLLRNALLLAVAALAGASVAAGPAPPALAGVASAALAGLVGAVVLMWFDEIAELFIGPAVTAAAGSGPDWRGGA